MTGKSTGERWHGPDRRMPGAANTRNRRRDDLGSGAGISRALPFRQPSETARFDAEKLETLCARLGETRAEAEAARALDRIAATLAAVDRLSTNGLPGLPRLALRTLARDADMIGMTSLAQVSVDVLACLDRCDRTALAATLARLRRVGARCMHAVWDLDDLVE